MSEIVENESESKYVTLAVVKYDPNKGTEREGDTTENEIVRLPTFCRQADVGDSITFKSYRTFEGEVLAKETYGFKDDYLSMLLLMSHRSLETLPTVEAKVEKVRVTR